jgi:hypothetical protein
MLVINTLEDWQDLVAGVLTLLAALWAGYLLHRQITQTDRIETARMRRRYLAARATLPLTLSALGDYARACVVPLNQLIDQLSGESLPRTATVPDMPRVPTTGVTELERMIEAAPNEDVAIPIADLLSKMQVLSSRISSIATDLAGDRMIITRLNIQTYVLDVAELDARIRSMFDYARRRSEVVPRRPTATDVTMSLQQLGFYEEDHADLHKMATRVFKVEE